MLIVVLILASCDVDNHEHSYQDIVTNPTCAEEGYTVHICECGDSYIDNYVSAIEHAYEVLEVIEPTCTEDGFTTYICECGDNYIDYIDANGHEHEVSEVIESTCTEDGYTVYTCKCGDTYNYDYVDANGHIEVINQAVDATCTKTGLTEGKYCSVCGEVLVAQEVVNTTKCVPGDWIVDLESTVTENGSYHTECIMCGEFVESGILYASGSIGLEYILNDDGMSYSVKSIGTCESTDIIIPHFYNQLPVTGVAQSAFGWCFSLTSIVIPDSVTSIGDTAFFACTSLKSVSMGNSVTHINAGAFGSCVSLETIIIPDSVTMIGTGAFSGCELLTNVTIGNS